jgi:hypothetical protein
MGKSVMALGNELREVFAQVIETALTADYDVLRVPLSADSTSDGFQLAIPTVDSENNEKTVLLHISVPKGNRDGVPYDPYEEHERYKENVAAKKDREAKRAEKKARLEAERSRKKEAKKTVKTMKKDIEEIFGGDKPTEEA